MRFLFGPFIIALGVLMMKYTYWITQQTGTVDFAERFFKPPLGGTYTWWRLVGLFIIILALLWMGGFLSGPTGAEELIK